jgi:hypothetical protein
MKYTKITPEVLIKTLAIVGSNLDQVDKQNLVSISTSPSKITLINTSHTLKELKKTLGTVTKQGRVTIVNYLNKDGKLTIKHWPTGLISNFKQVAGQDKDRRFPSLAIILNTKSYTELKLAEKELNNCQVPSAFFHDTSQKPRGMISILTNIKSMETQNLFASLLQRAVNVGILKKTLRLSYKIFPRLGSNQWPRT